MGSLLRTLLRSVRHPQNSGQAVIVLALGFMGLVGFVGIVTDVSILLARYNTLSRAVDSAAISAAGQMRSDRSFGEVGLAARMMLELHGIDSTEILVETCASSTSTVSGVTTSDPVLCSEANRFRKLVRVGATINSPTVFLRLLGVEDIQLSAISTSETAVLDIVMIMDVSESMLLDTTYQDWANIGMGQVYVPPIAGTDEGVLGDYNYSSILTRERNADVFRNGGDGRDPDTGDLYPDVIQFWGEYLLGDVRGVPRIFPEDVNRRLDYRVAGTNAEVTNPHEGVDKPNYRVFSFPYPGSVGAQIHPRTACRVRFWPYSTNINIPRHIRTIPGFATYWEGHPASQTTNLSNKQVKWGGFVPSFDFYGCCNDPSNGGYIDASGKLTPLDGYSTSDFARESGDFRFNDLICQPFKQARDAAREFLQTVDFDRGDRVSFVTFDKGAFLIDPDGANGRPDTNPDTCERDPAPSGGKTTWTHMLASRCRAERTLDQFVGVRAEPNFYAWNEDGGGWVAFARGRNADGSSKLVDYYNQDASGGYAGAVLQDGKTVYPDRTYNDYPVKDACPLHNAALSGWLSLYSLWDWDYYTSSGMTNFTARRAGTPGLVRIMNPSPTLAGWSDLSEGNSYELWASCRGTNIGAGLREGNNALLDPTTTRRTGTVWVMIMLSDGAAGASDPVRLNGRKPAEADPFYDYGSNRLNWQTWDGVANLVRYGAAGEYGAFGLCPIGTPTQRTRLTRNLAYDGPSFPFCGDIRPETRHFCDPSSGDPNSVGLKCSGTSAFGYGFAPGSFDEDYECTESLDYNLINGRIYDVDIGNFPNQTASECDPLYDVDDYARDWADYVSLSRSSAGDEQLPTIFTIGFGLNFLIQDAAGTINPADDPSSPSYQPYPARYNIPDFLGEELLRYIADVGDNFQIDTDYQQDLKQDRTLEGYLCTTGPDCTEVFGVRGPCEDPTVVPNSSGEYIGDSDALMGNGFATVDGGTGLMVRPLAPRQDCGNYYNAPDQGRLQLVFDDIASRMFTRLAP